MYNEELKQRFLKEFGMQSKHVSTQCTYNYALNCIASLEESINTDLCSITTEQLRAFIKDWHLSPGTACEYILIANNYTKWCVNAGILKGELTSHRIKDFTTEDFIPWASENLIKDANNMIEKMALILPVNQGMNIFPIMCFVWEGLTAPTAAKLKNDQVDLKKGIIYDVKHKVFADTIDPDILEILRNYKNTNFTFRKKPVPRNPLAETRVYPAQTGYFITPFLTINRKPKTETINFTAYISAFMNKQKCYEKEHGISLRINQSSVSISGTYNRMYKMEQSGAFDERRMTLEDVNKAYRRTTHSAVLKPFILGYEAYKTVFDL